MENFVREATRGDLADQVDAATISMRILLESAREEIEQRGVLGLRVAAVARRANCSVTQIYRYFGSRNGLIAHALGDLYQIILQLGIDSTKAHLGETGPLTVDEVMEIFVSPKAMASMPYMPVRLQILAVASTIPELEQRLAHISQEMFLEWKALIRNVQLRLPPETHMDDRAITIDLVMMMPFYSRLLGDAGATDDEYSSWVRHKLFPKTSR